MADTQLDKEDYYWLNDNARGFLSRGYLLEGTTAEERVRDIAERAEELLQGMYERENGLHANYPKLIDEFADRFEHNMARGYYSLASPVWSNFGLERGLPISCFGSYIGDSVKSIMRTHAEVGMMTKVGGGTSGYFGDVRPRGAKITNNGTSNGTHPFAQLFDKLIDVVSQGNTRRGHFAGYIPIEHGDIEEWLNIQQPGDKIQTMMYGVTVGDEWLQEMIDGDQKKREIWAQVLKNRSGEIGAPYIMFRDNANNNKPQVYQDKEKQILASNLCSEIMLPSNEDESFVCCLSSINASRYREWEDTNAVEVMTYFLDAVMEEFIQKADGVPYLDRAVNFARRQRAIGIGVLGWHTLLQQEMTPFDSMEASMLNAQLFGQVREESYAASEELASHLGEPQLMEGYGRRNATTMAVAPTKSSSYILGQVSQGIEPIKANYFVRDAAKKQSTFKNPRLEALLEEKGENTRETWRKIKEDQGSVQNLDCLAEHEKNVFRTFGEIPQLAVIKQAAQRQQFIDQSQSLNLSIDPQKTSAKEINALYLEAWKLGVKSLYYQKSSNAAQSFAANHMHCEACGG